MRVIDLTHTIHAGMQVFPGTEPPAFERANTFERDGFRETKITMYSHTGTHMDAPAHMLSSGPCLDNLDVEHFIGNAAILDFSNVGKGLIDSDSLKPHEEMIKNAEFIIIKTGWSKYWGDKKYFEDFPSLSKEAAQRLTGFNLKGVGIDAISIDPMNSTTFDVHKILMAGNILIIENLTNLDAVSGRSFILCVMPMKNKDADGSPVRAVAIENI